MKRILHQLFCLLMACIVLISSTGFGLVEHSCMMRGKKMYLAAQTQKKGCPSCSKQHAKANPDEGKTVIKKSDCCQEQSQYRHVSFASSLSQLAVKFIKDLADLAVLGVSVLVQWLVGLLIPLKESVRVAVFSSFSLSGRELLAFVQRLLL